MPLHADQPPFRAVIHLGAGREDRLQEFRNRGAEQILLVEPDSRQAAGLKRRLADQAGVRVLAAAAGTQDGVGDLRVMSLPALNSLAAPAPALNALYPGLRQERVQEVETLSPESLMGEIDARLRPLLLVIDCAGQELALLKAWKAAGQLAKVDLLDLRCGEEAFHSGSAGRTELEAWLTAEGFTVTGRDLQDPDWPVLHLQIDQTARALAGAEARIAALEATLVAQTAELDAAHRTLAERTAASDKALTDAKAATEAKAALLAETEARLKTATDRATSLDKTVSQLRAQIALQGEEAARDRYDLQTARQDLGLALRLQSRMQADLRALQDRHATTLAEKAEHETLLRQLTPRLREAAQHLQALSLLETKAPRASLPPSRAGKSGKSRKS